MRLFRELKRRKVLQTLSLYVVACWVALQVVEVLSGAGLPPLTMRYLLVAMSIGFPVALVIAWFFDVSASGITRTPAAEFGAELPELNLGDFALTAGLLAVVALNIFVLSSPPPETVATNVAAERRTLVVIPFEDVGLQDGEDPIGEAVAGELREDLTRVAGLKVLGRETSLMIQSVGDSRDNIAAELGVTSILAGDVSLSDGRLSISSRLIALPAGNIVWQGSQEGNLGDGPEMQRGIVQAVIDAILPPASARSTHAPRILANECSRGYDQYLRGKQLRSTRNWQRGLELLEEAVRVDPECAVAWEALAAASLGWWSKADLAKSGAAARRALELNESMPKAWAVLAEIAEEERRWGESEELFLRALYVDPTDAFTNMQFGEGLLARGRVRDALHYVLEAYRYEPASHGVNWKVTLAARYLEDVETLIKHATIYRELRGDRFFNGWDELGEAYRLMGDVERALSYWNEVSEILPDWYPQCVRASLDPTLAAGLAPKVRASLEEHLMGDSNDMQSMFRGSFIIRCATWIDEPEIVVELFESDRRIPTEAQFLMFFQADSGILRQTEHFRRKVVEAGLLDYWREWGWSDYCRADSDSFTCD